MLGILPSVLVAYGVLLTGIRLKGYFGCSFLKTKFSVPTILDLVLGRVFLLTYMKWPLLLQNRHYIGWIPFLRANN